MKTTGVSRRGGLNLLDQRLESLRSDIERTRGMGISRTEEGLEDVVPGTDQVEGDVPVRVAGLLHRQPESEKVAIDVGVVIPKIRSDRFGQLAEPEVSNPEYRRASSVVIEQIVGEVVLKHHAVRISVMKIVARVGSK